MSTSDWCFLNFVERQVSLLFLLLNVITTQAPCRALGNDKLLLTGFDFCWHHLLHFWNCTRLPFLRLDWFHLNRREKRLEAFQTASWFEDLKDNSTRERLCEEQQVVLNNIAKILDICTWQPVNASLLKLHIYNLFASTSKCRENNKKSARSISQ